MFKPESLTQTVVPGGQMGTAVWQNGLNKNHLSDQCANKRSSQPALCLVKSNGSPNSRFMEIKTFSPTTNNYNGEPSTLQSSLPSSRRHCPQRRRSRSRPPSYHRVMTTQSGPSGGRSFANDANSRGEKMLPRYPRIPTDAFYYSYYSDEESASYYYIDNPALPYDQWKQLLRQGSLSEIASSPSSLALATEWLVWRCLVKREWKGVGKDS